jgi:hypothetical protein
MSGLRPLLEAPVGHGPVSAFFAAGCCMRDKQVVPSPPFLSVLSVSLTASRPPPIPFDVLDRGVSHGTFVLASSNPTTLRLAAWRGRRGARRTLFIQDSPQSKAPQLVEDSAHKGETGGGGIIWGAPRARTEIRR